MIEPLSPEHVMWLRRLIAKWDHLEREVWTDLEELIDGFLHRAGHRRYRVPSAPLLSADSGDSMSTVELSLVLPTTRSDGSPLDPADIGSVVFQKTSLTTDTPPVAGPTTALASTPSTLTFTDTKPVVGDVYSAFVSDKAGEVGLISNTFTVPEAAPTPAVPGAPTLTAVYTP